MGEERSIVINNLHARAVCVWMKRGKKKELYQKVCPACSVNRITRSRLKNPIIVPLPTSRSTYRAHIADGLIMAGLARKFPRACPRT